MNNRFYSGDWILYRFNGWLVPCNVVHVLNDGLLITAKQRGSWELFKISPEKCYLLYRKNMLESDLKYDDSEIPKKENKK